MIIKFLLDLKIICFLTKVNWIIYYSSHFQIIEIIKVIKIGIIILNNESEKMKKKTKIKKFFDRVSPFLKINKSYVLYTIVSIRYLFKRSF